MSPTPTAAMPPREFEADVVVVGAGTAGALASLAAASEGVSVIAVERDFAPGGTGTRGGVHFYYHGSSGGHQECLDAEIKKVERVFGARGGSYHPEAKRVVLSRRMREGGVRVLYNSILCGVEMKGRAVAALRCCDDDGFFSVRGKVFIDSSGDGDLAAGAGADFTFGREFDGASHQYSFVSRSLHRRAPSFRWEVGFNNYDAGWVDPTDPHDFTRALIEGRRLMRGFLSPEAPLEAARRMLGAATHLGVREGRHIVGDYVVTFLDFLRGRTYPDVVCVAKSHYDSHARDMANDPWICQAWHVALAMYRQGGLCQIPYRSLLPRGIDNLLVACRALSVDREASLAIRMQRDMQKVGEVAGVAAAQAVRYGAVPRQIDVAALQRRLVERGVLKEGDCRHPLIPLFSFPHGALAGRPLSGMDISSSPLEYAALLPGLVSYLGTGEEGKALWWMYLLRECDHAPLVAKVGDPDYRTRRGAAFGLAMMGDPRAVPVLVECLEKRDAESPPPDIKTFPRWVAALVFLRHLRAPQGWRLASALLREKLDDRLCTFALAYLHDVAGSLSDAEKVGLAEAVREFQGCDEMGRAYAAQGSPSQTLDVRWNVDLWVYRLLAALGVEEGALPAAYRNDPRPFVRRIWARAFSSRPGLHLQPI